MSMNYLRSASEWALMVALVFGAGAIARAQEEEAPDQKGVVQIGRADEEQSKPNLPPPGGFPDLQQPQQPMKYWIGLAGGAIPADSPLRAHLDLPENQGLLVANIVPDGPAAKAGLKQHDILLAANDTDLKEMQDLVEIVLAEGPKKGQITLEVFRAASVKRFT
jgi:membrane-associated protease RseP (regulator of RpoE activity)